MACCRCLARRPDAVGVERLLIGFPGVGGTLEDTIVKYVIVPRFLQPTTLGEPDGRLTVRLQHVATEFRRAGFPGAILVGSRSRRKRCTC